MDYKRLADPNDIGAEVLKGFASAEEIAAVLGEASDPEKIQWIDSHDNYVNQRGLEITQNHFTFALKLSAGDQSILGDLPATVGLYHRTQRFIRSLDSVFPSLVSWTADELSFHLYDDKKVGISRHRDNLRFIGLVAIISVDGEGDLVITHNGEEITLPVEPGI